VNRLSASCRRFVGWVWSWFAPARVVVPCGPFVSEDPQIVTTRPGACIAVEVRTRRETPHGIARLAQILDRECR